MTLSLNYNSLTTGIVNFLQRNQSLLDSGLYASVTTIRDFDMEQYLPLNQNYPAISVDLKKKDERRVDIALGENSRREINCYWNIGCHVRTIDSSTAIMQAMRQLVTNVEYTLRTDDTLSNTVDMTEVLGSDFGVLIQMGTGAWQKTGRIMLRTYHKIA